VLAMLMPDRSDCELLKTGVSKGVLRDLRAILELRWLFESITGAQPLIVAGM